MCAFAAIGACKTAPAFVCTSDGQCGDGGVCEAVGFCSFPDGECDSGRRYEPNADGEFAGRCVPEDAGSTGPDPTTGGETVAGDTTGDGESTDTGSSEATETTETIPPRPSIVVDPASRFQTLDGMGIQAWDYPINDNGWNWKTIAPRFNEVEIHYAQLITLFSRWEPANDNAEPTVVEPAAFDPSGDIAGQDVPMAEFLNERSLGLTVQNVQMPGWLQDVRGAIPESNYEEFAESVISYHQYLEDVGVASEAIEIEKVGTEIGWFVDPEAAAAVGEQLVSSMEAFGLERPLLTPSVAGLVADDWLGPWFQSEVLTDATVAISIRGQATSDPADFQRVAAWSESTGKPVWAYDNWYCGADEGCPAAPAEDSTTWATAWEMAQQNWRLIVHARATRIYHAAMVGAQPSVTADAGEKNPTFFVLEHFANWIPPGSVRVEATSDIAEVWPVVVERPDGTMSLIVLNTGFVDSEIDLALASSGVEVLGPPLQSIAGEYLVETPYDTVDGALSLSLPPFSLTSLHFTSG